MMTATRTATAGLLAATILVAGCASSDEPTLDAAAHEPPESGSPVPRLSRPEPSPVESEQTVPLLARPEQSALDARRSNPGRASSATARPLERNLTMKTLGGRQFWGDVQFFHGWRIQQNVFTHHYRLLDERDYRHASGTLEQCRTRLAELREQQQLPPMCGKAVVFVHGIIRSSKSFHKMRARFEQDGYCTFGFDYPSTRVTIPEAAEYLHQCLSSLEGVEEINLVVHSMGGLVVRTYLMEHQDPRIRRMVMIGVPNLGAHMADHLQKNLLFRTIFGPAGQQLVSSDGCRDGESAFIASLPVPEFEFGIIAGSRGTDTGYNPLIPGDDDGTVNIECTKLPGAADFTTVRGLHSFLMNTDEAVESAVRFVETGRFRDAAEIAPSRIGSERIPQ